MSTVSCIDHDAMSSQESIELLLKPRKSFCRPLKRARDTGNAVNPPTEAGGYGSYGGFAVGG